MANIDLPAIHNALKSISPYIHRTPTVYSNSFSKMFGAEVFIKAENLQKTGSFKVRGAFNKLIRSKSDKVIAASMGNHAQGVAFAAMSLGLKASIVMPVTASIVKPEKSKVVGKPLTLVSTRFCVTTARRKEK